MKRILAMAISVVLVATMAIGGSIAYLTDTAEDVNVMVMGNVEIEQFEMQRADDVAYNASASKEANTLVAFEQGQKLYPAVPVGELPFTAAPGSSGDESTMTEMFKWGDYTTATLDGNGLWYDDKLYGAMDKFVFVENTGKSDCYFRTIIAYECPEGMTYGDVSRDNIGTNVNAAYAREHVGFIVINGTRYTVSEYIYNDVRLNGEILPAGATARPSLLQIAMNPSMTNEDVEKFGNTYDVLVYTQAVQADNFKDIPAEDLGGKSNAEYALDAAFGDVTVANNPWITTDEAGNVTENVPSIPAYVNNIDDLKKANEEGKSVYLMSGNYKLDGDLGLNNTLYVADDAKVTIDLNGKTVSKEDSNGIVIRNYGDLTLSNGTVKGNDGNYGIRSEGGSVTVKSNVKVDGGFGAMSLFGNTVAVIEEGAELTAVGRTSSTCHLIFASGASNLTINGGTFTHNTGGKIDSGHVVTSMGTATVNIYGGTFNGGYYGNVNEYSPTTSTINVHAGNFQQNPSSFVPSTSTATQNADSTWTVTVNN